VSGDAKVCEQCGADFSRRRSPSGKVEDWTAFRKRRFCQASCARRWQMLNRYSTDPMHPGKRTILAATCRACGVLLDASRFARNSDGYMQLAACMACASRRKRTNYSDRQRAFESEARHNRHVSKWHSTVETAANHYKEWTGPELEFASRDDLGLLEMAKALGRTYAAVSQVRQAIRSEPKRQNVAGLSRRQP